MLNIIKYEILQLRELNMKLKLHHINLCTSNVKDMDKFYREVLCLGDDEPSKLPPINLVTAAPVTVPAAPAK